MPSSLDLFLNSLIEKFLVFHWVFNLIMTEKLEDLHALFVGHVHEFFCLKISYKKLCIKILES